MNYGALKTLLLMLQQAPTLQGCSVLFGEENINAEDASLPMVVLVPVGGQWDRPGDQSGYFQNANPNLNAIWMTNESIDVYLWSGIQPNTSPTPQPIDNADAVEILRARVLQAFQNQRVKGLFYKPVSGRWERMGDGNNRYGRGYVLTVQVDITVPDVLYPEVPVRDVITNVSIES